MAFALAGLSGYLGWPRQFAFLIATYALVGAVGTRGAPHPWRRALLLASPWLIVCGGTAALYQLAHIYPLVLAAPLGAVAGTAVAWAWGANKKRQAVALAGAAAAAALTGWLLLMPNWLALTLNQPAGPPAIDAAVTFSYADRPERAYAVPNDFGGRVVMLDFWSTSCIACFAQFPDLDALHADYADDPRVEIVAVNLREPDDREGEARQMMDRYSYGFRSAYSPMLLTEARDVFGFQGVPSAVVYDPQGEIAFVGSPEFGSQVFVSNIRRTLDRVLAESGPAE